MGLSASQGRMLLLTARKSDLEFRAQQISQKRLVLASQLEDISTAYENATSNRQMQISLYSNAADESGKPITKTTNLTYAALVSGTLTQNSNFTGLQASERTQGQEYTSNTFYRLRNADGAIVISDISEIPGWKDGSLEKMPKNTKDMEFSGSDGVEIKVTKGKDGVITAEKDGIKYVIDPALKYGSTDQYGNEGDGPNYLQDCLRNGKYLIEKGTVETTSYSEQELIVRDTNSDGTISNEERAAAESAENKEYKTVTKTSVTGIKWSNISWDATSNISDKYYLEDDDTAKAKYDREQTQIQNQDKKLELELDNIETQRSAVTTETESVQKVIDDNIESSFKSFA